QNRLARLWVRRRRRGGWPPIRWLRRYVRAPWLETRRLRLGRSGPRGTCPWGRVRWAYLWRPRLRARRPGPYVLARPWLRGMRLEGPSLRPCGRRPRLRQGISWLAGGRAWTG